MKLFFYTLIVIAISSISVLGNANSNTSVSFIENKGQVVDMNNEKRNEFLFYSKSENLDIYFRKEGVTYIFHKGDKAPSSTGSRKEYESRSKEFLLKKTLYYRLDLNFTNHSNSIEAVGEDKQDFYTNYYLPQCPDGLTFVSNYSTIKYKNVYKGIDFKFYVHEGKLKYDIILQPQANINDINLTFNGANDVAVLNNIISIQSPVGLIEESLPKSFVIHKNGKEKNVEVAYSVKGNKVQFTSTYDVNQTLVIDPQLSWTTYYDDPYVGFGTAHADVKGIQFVVSGDTYSSAFPTLNPGASAYYQNAIAGNNDYLLVQFDTNSILKWATYYGGSNSDYRSDVVIDYAGNIVLIGTTESTNMPTQNAGGYYDGTYTPFPGFGSGGGCVFKFNSSGVRLWGTYYDFLTYSVVDVDLNNNIYVVGQSRNTSPPVLALAGAYNQAAITPVGGSSSTDIFIVKFDASTNRTWATNLGGTSDEEVNDVHIGNDNYVNIVSRADNYYGAGFVSLNAGGYFDNVLGTAVTDREDDLIYRFNTSGALVWGTAFGGSKTDYVYKITTDNTNNIYIIGNTQSTNIPFVNPGGGAYFDNTFSTTYTENEFLAKFNSATQLLWCTYFGGASTYVSHTQFIGINNANNLVAITSTDQNTYPLVPRVGDYNAAFVSDMDTYIAEFDNNLAIAWSTYFGITDREIMGAAALSNDPCGYTIYATLGWQGGATTSPPWVNPGGGAYIDNTYSSTGSSLIAKFSSVITSPTITATSSGGCQGSTTLTVTGPTSYTWSTGATTSSIVVSPTITTTYTVLTGSGTCTSSTTQSVAVSPVTSPTITASSTTLSCGGSVTLTVTGATSYTWDTGATTSSIVVSPSSNTTYTVITGTNPCTVSATQSITVNGAITPTITASSSTVSCGSSVTLTATGGTTYTWSTGAISNSIVVSPTANTNYTVETTTGSCTSNTIQLITVTPNPSPNITASSTTLSCGSSATLTATGATTYTWSTGATTSTIVVNPTSTSTYTVLTGSGTCTSSAVQTITVSSSVTPTITASSATLSCGSSATLTATGSITYTWSTGATTSSIVVNPTSTSTYTVLTGSGTCTSSAVQTITVSSSVTPTITASSATLSCGSSATLTATGSITYTWSTGATTSSIVVNPTSTSTYTVLTGSGTCTSSAVQTITVSSSVTPTITASSATLSCGSSATLTVTGVSTYTWNTGATTSSIVVNPTSTSSYTVLTGSGTCTNSAVQTITVSSSATPTITASSTTVSCGSSVTLTTTGATTYTWNTGATTSTIVVNPTSTSTYTVLTGSGSCTNSSTISVIYIPSTVTLAISPDVTIISGSQTQLTVIGNGASYIWSPALGLSCTTCTNPIANPVVTSTYCALTSLGNCTAQACVLVNVEVNCNSNKEYAVPNAFSPNGDGYNDEFCLQGWKGCVTGFLIKIYDRWGEKVYESTDENFCWDGVYRGQLLDPAVFVYYIQATIEKTGPVAKKGNITLIK